MKSASSKQMSFLQQLPSLGVQQHGFGSDSTHAQVSATSQTTSPAHPAASSEQMSSLQQLPSSRYMLVSNHSGVQQHGFGSDSTHAQVSAASQTTSPAHPAASSEQMPSLQQLPSSGYMLVLSNNSGVQQHGCALESSREPGGGSHDVQQQEERRWDYDRVDGLTPYTFK